MKDRDNDLRIRPGRIRSTCVQRTRPIINQVLAATRKAGGQLLAALADSLAVSIGRLCWIDSK